MTLSVIFLIQRQDLFFLTKLLISGILFSAADNYELVAKHVILGTLPSISETLVSKSVFFTKLLTLSILFSTTVKADFVTKLLTSGIFPSISITLVLKSGF